MLVIFGIIGHCRGEELTKIRVQDVKEQGELVMVTIPETQFSTQRQFIIGKNLSRIVKKYTSLRPKNVVSNRYFLIYRIGKCIPQPMGKNTVLPTPKDIAEWLQLKDPNLYTGHAIKRIAASSPVEAANRIMQLQNLGE